MTLRFVPTPLGGRFIWPEPRDDGFGSELRSACVPAPGSEVALARLQTAGTLVVTTGQQPALFTGPLYTIHKALSAAALARRLEHRWQRPVVPVFWVAGDDHDFAEANHAAWIGTEGTLGTTTLRTRPADAALTPLYREPLGPNIESALAALEGDLPASEFRDWTVAWLRRHYRPEATVGSSFAHALAELVAPLGVVCLDSTHVAAKRAAAPYLLRALELAPQLDDELTALLAELERAGHHSGVNVGVGATLVMLEGKLGRDRLVREGTEFHTRRSGEQMSREALERIAAEAPERLSPNVLLRPVIESALLPTVAYVAGPSELKYLALTPPIYRLLEVRRQAPMPRWSGLLVEARIDRVLEKFGASLEELLEPGQSLENRVTRSQLPEEAILALTELKATIEREYAVVEHAAVAIDPTLEKPVQGARNHALSGIQDIEKRLINHLKKRQDTDLKQILRARTALAPGGKPQERVLTVAPFLARHGAAFMNDLEQHIEGWYAAALEATGLPS